MTANLLKFPGLLSVFWPILTELSFGWSPLAFLFPILPVPLVSPPLSSSIVFFSFLARSSYLFLFSPSFNFTLWSAGTAKFTIRQVLGFLLTMTRSGRLSEIMWSVCVSKSQKIFCVSFSRRDSRLCIYHLFVWSNFNCFAPFLVDLPSRV